jgi:hypothetical protein
MFYTYAHFRPDGRVFYIGKGSGNRYLDVGRNTYWNNVVTKEGGFTAEILAEWPTEKEAFEHEVFLIKCFKDLGFKLCNLTDGGEGPSGAVVGPETRAKLSASTKALMALPGDHHMRGKRHTKEAREKTSAALIGRIFSQETLAKMSASHSGKVLSQDTRDKIRASASGKTLSGEHRAKIGDALRGRVLSDEIRAKFSASHKGKPMSQETKQKISAFWKTKKAEKFSKQFAEGAIA